VVNTNVRTDPFGYHALARWLEFAADEAAAFGENEIANEIRFAGRFASGSPSEFLYEAGSALRRLSEARSIPPPIRSFSIAIRDEIDRGFELVGGA
jgi:hypothetical protein